MKTELITMAAPARAAERAAAILRAGGLVGLPTETVYGLGADGLNEAAVRRIFEAKGRPQDNPLILHVPEAVWLDRYCLDIPAEARDLAARFWPGPLTMILKRREIVPDAVTCGLETVGVRCPDHPAALAVIRAAGGASRGARRRQQLYLYHPCGFLHRNGYLFHSSGVLRLP